MSRKLSLYSATLIKINNLRILNFTKNPQIRNDLNTRKLPDLQYMGRPPIPTSRNRGSQVSRRRGQNSHHCPFTRTHIFCFFIVTYCITSFNLCFLFSCGDRYDYANDVHLIAISVQSLVQHRQEIGGDTCLTTLKT